jgi:hypothetical protein
MTTVLVIGRDGQGRVTGSLRVAVCPPTHRSHTFTNRTRV